MQVIENNKKLNRDIRQLQFDCEIRSVKRTIKYNVLTVIARDLRGAAFVLASIDSY